MNKRKMWVPDIIYEEGSKIPFVQVEVDKDMPDILHVYEYKMTGEFSPGPEGEDVPHMDVYIHQYIDQEALRAVLDDDTVNRVRKHIGLEPLADAKTKGDQLTSNVVANAEENNSEKKVH